MALKDITGQRFGRLTVLYRDNSKPKGHGQKAWWICKCDCGNIKSVKGENLRRGLTKSCGCLHKETMRKLLFEDLTGQQFGFLMPLYITGEQDRYGSYIWHCKCLNCGNFKDVSASYLKQGSTKSCGCVSSSYGETMIKQILKEHNIPFIKEYSFDDCKSLKNYKLRFDFAIFKNSNLYCLVEFQGKQHYKDIKIKGSEESLEERQQRDNIKREYCKKNNIKLIEIPYTDKEKLSWAYLKEKCNLWE